MRLLAVPLFRQTTRTNCVPACVKMVLSYYGHRASQAKISRAMGTLRVGGTTRSKCANFLRSQGFDVTLREHWSFFPNAFQSKDRRKSRTSMRRWCQREMRCEMPAWRRYGSSLLKFIDTGGRFVPKPIAIDEVWKEIRAGRPVIVCPDARVLTGRRTFHAVVVIGMDAKHVWVNDPSRKKNSGEIRLPMRLFKKACGTDGCGAVFVKPHA